MVKGIINLICLIIVFYAALFLIHSSVSETDGQKLLAKEYEVPMDFVPYIERDKYFLLIPHTVYYVTTNMGEDVTLCTSYFGINFFNDENIEKYLGLSSIKEELKSRGYYEWAK